MKKTLSRLGLMLALGVGLLVMSGCDDDHAHAHTATAFGPVAAATPLQPAAAPTDGVALRAIDDPAAFLPVAEVDLATPAPAVPAALSVGMIDHAACAARFDWRDPGWLA